MRFVYIFSLSFLFQFAYAQQIECEYIPLHLEDIDTEWRHLTIDSSWIGIITPNGSFESTTQDGMFHIRIMNKTLKSIDEKTLFSVMIIYADLDIQGYYIEALDIPTGDLIWTNKSDMFTDTITHKVLDVQIQGDHLLVHGVVPEEDDDFWDSLGSGWVNSYYYRKAYNINTGQLAENYYSNRETAQVLTTAIRKDYLFFETDNIYWIEQDVSDSISYLVKHVMNSQAELISKDSVYQLNYSDVLDEHAINSFTWRDKLLRNQNQYLYLEQFTPKANSDKLHEAKLTIYDDDFNPMKSIKLENYKHKEFHALTIEEFTDDRIVIRGDLKDIWGEYFFYIFDRNLELIDTIDCIYNDQYIYKSVEHIIDENNVLHYWQRDYEEPHVLLRYYRSNESGTLNLIEQFSVEEPEWIGSVKHMELLNNGDVLLRMFHGCRVDHNTLASWHHEWWRISGEELGIMVSTEELAQDPSMVYPNPTAGLVYLPWQDHSMQDLKLYNAMGQQLMHISQPSNSIDLSSYDRGMYFIYVSDHTGVEYNYRVLKQ